MPGRMGGWEDGRETCSLQRALASFCHPSNFLVTSKMRERETERERERLCYVILYSIIWLSLSLPLKAGGASSGEALGSACHGVFFLGRPSREKTLLSQEEEEEAFFLSEADGTAISFKAAPEQHSGY